MPDSEIDEFAIIARYFAPLATSESARGLVDDVALLAHSGALVLTTDAIVEGVHFLPEDKLEFVARKALRVNLSDLAAKGAAPVGYLLALFWPQGRPSAAVAEIAAGLAMDNREFGLELLGGDTVTTPGPLSLSITMLGRAGPSAPSRAGATPGDGVWVTGAIGDAALGLGALRGEAFSPADHAFLAARYHLPSPRLAAGKAIAGVASAAMDVSDGLIADAAKIAAASGVCVEIELDEVPLSPAAARWVAGRRDRLAALLRLATGGDDYEILFTSSDVAAVDATRIGRVVAGEGLKLTMQGQPTPLPAAGGYVHRFGR